ncbi:MAG: hypothetical protein GXP31_04815 [Kiritimatiellaeota bacterium]|nr:hypothetical protein [Kiritimatiellota bacterium]
MQRTQRRRGLLLLVAGILGAWAAQPSAARDYGQGIAALRRLGLPDVSRAQYIRLDRQWSPLNYSTRTMGWDPLRQLKLTGNAWLLREDTKNKTGDIVRVTGRKLTLRKIESGAPNQILVTVGPVAQPDVLPGGSWRPADPKPDIARITAALRKCLASKKNEGRTQTPLYYRLASDSDPDNTRYGSKLFLRLALYYVHGEKEGANAALDLLMQVVNDPAGVVRGAYAELAMNRYQAAFDSLIRAGDWSALAKSLSNILETYKSNWAERPGLAYLLEQTKKQLQAQAPALEGAGFSPDQQELARLLANARLADGMALRSSQWNVNTSWLFPADPSAKQPRDTASRPLTAKLSALRFEAIPVLVRLLGDEWLVAVPRQLVSGLGMQVFQFATGGMGNLRKSTDPRQAFQKLQIRPSTRGELAMSLLHAVLPGKKLNAELGRNNFGGFVPGMAGAARTSETKRRKMIADYARAFYDKEKNSTPNDLLWRYAREGDDMQRTTALNALMTRAKSDTDWRTIEEAMTRPPRTGPGRAADWSDMSLVPMYVSVRGKAALPFLKTYLAAKRKELAHLEKQPKSKVPTPGAGPQATVAALQERNQVDSRKQSLKQLISLVEPLLEMIPQPPDQALDTAMKAKNSPWVLPFIISMKFGGRPGAEVLTKLLKRAVDAKTPQETMTVLAQTRMMSSFAMTLTPDGRISNPSQQMNLAARRTGSEANWIEEHGRLQRMLLDFPSQKQYWLALFKQTRVTGKPSTGTPVGRRSTMMRIGLLAGLPPQARTVSVAAASLFLNLYSPSDTAAIQNLLSMAPEAAAGLLCRRAAAILDGKDPKDLPPIPTADQVSKDQRQALKRKLSAASQTGPAALAAEFAKLTAAEQMALQEELATDTDFAGKLAGLANRIRKVAFRKETAPPLRSLLESLRNKALDKKALLEICKLCRKEVAAGRTIDLVVRRAGMDGVKIEAGPVDDDVRLPPMVTAMISGFNQAGSMVPGGNNPFLTMGLLTASVGTGAQVQWGGQTQQWWVSVNKGKTGRGKGGQSNTAGKSRNQDPDQLLAGAAPGAMGGMNPTMMFDRMNGSADERFADSLDNSLFGPNLNPLDAAQVRFIGLPPRVIKKLAAEFKKNGGANPFDMMNFGD